jgi:hypothetical protein
LGRNIIEIDEKVEEEEYIECPVCYETLTKEKCVEFNCAHTSCFKCLSVYLKTCQAHLPPTCFICRRLIETVEVRDENTKKDATILLGKKNKIVNVNPSDISYLYFQNNTAKIRNMNVDIRPPTYTYMSIRS